MCRYENRSILDNDKLRKPDPRSAQVYAVDGYTPVTKDSVIQKYPAVFSTGVGLLAGEYHIRVDPLYSMLLVMFQ